MTARQRLESLGFVCEGTGGNCKAMILRTSYPVPGRPGQCVDSGDPQIITVGWYEGESGAAEGRGTTETYATVDEMIAAVRSWLDWRAHR